MKPKNQNRSCPDVLSNECIVWQGGDVPVLGICNGDFLSDAEKVIADKVVELFDDIDMSEIDMNCLISTCAQKCKDTSLKAIIQVLFDNQCCLRDLINSAGGGSNTVTVNLNLRCLKKFDDFGNEIPQDLNQSLQSIVNQVCATVTDVNSIKVSIIDLQNQIDVLQTTPTVTPEPSITTCLTPGLRTVSQTVPIVAQALCDFKTQIGNNTDISIAISQQCSDLNGTFATVQGWISAVQNFAQSVNNLWLLACNLNDRITTIEENCCSLTCDDIKLGFAVQVDADGVGVFLKFTAGAGTSIPNGFTDAGSSVIFTDKNGEFLTYPLVIANNANLGDFDLSGLDLIDPFTISVTAILATDGLTCEKCITRLYTINDTSCPVCQVTASGTTGNVNITYTIPGNTAIQSLILQNGQVGYIQKNASIMAISTSGDVTASSTCIDLTPPPTICYVFAWEHAPVGADTMVDAFFSEVILNNLTYTINSPYRHDIGTPIPVAGNAGQSLFSAITVAVPSGIVNPQCVITDTLSNSRISVTVPQSIGIPIIKINNPTSESDVKYLYMYGQVSTDSSTDCGCNGGGHGL